MTAPVASISLSSPPLFIPHEILGEILSHCDADTLAVASRVSSACLELASPLLYTDIVVRDLESVVKLFRLSPSFDAPLPKSDRVTPHTSLSIIHSITVLLKETSVDFDPLRNLALPPPLALPVFVVSMPGPDASDSPQTYDLSALAFLVNPRTLVVHERHVTLDSIQHRPSAVELVQGEESAATCNWDRLEIALLHRAFVSSWDLIDSRTSEVRLESDPPLPPLRMIVDLVSAPEKQFGLSEHARHFVDMDVVNTYLRETGIKLKGWVESERAKRVLEEKMKETDQQFVLPRKGPHADMEVVSDRTRRFKEDLALGARKGMDWAVLDEI